MEGEGGRGAAFGANRKRALEILGGRKKHELPTLNIDENVSQIDSFLIRSLGQSPSLD